MPTMAWLVEAGPPRRRLSTQFRVTCTCFRRYAKPVRVLTFVVEPSLDCSCQSILIPYHLYRIIIDKIQR